MEEQFRSVKPFPAFFAKPYRFKNFLQFRLYLDFLLRLNVFYQLYKMYNKRSVLRRQLSRDTNRNI